MEPLNSTTFHQFSAAPYKKNKDYAAGIWEAIRILNKGGQAEVLSDALIRQTLKDNTRTASVVAARDDNCICCMGTRISGPLMQCEHCKKKHIHFHCFKPPLKRLSEGIQKWFCDSCSLPLQSQPTVMFPVVRSGKPVPQWPFNLKPPRVSSGRVYELGSDSDSDEESEGAPQAKKRLKKIAKLKSDKKTSAVKKVAKLEEDDVAPEDDDEKKSVHSEGSSDKDQQKKSTFYSKNAYGKEQKPHAASRASPAINRSLLSPQSTQSQESIKSPVPVCDEEDEKCFICGDVGTLMLCDFPACPRVYHKVISNVQLIIHSIVLLLIFISTTADVRSSRVEPKRGRRLGDQRCRTSKQSSPGARCRHRRHLVLPAAQLSGVRGTAADSVQSAHAQPARRSAGSTQNGYDSSQILTSIRNLDY